MIRTFALVFTLIAIFGAIGYAQNLRGLEPLTFRNPRVLAGQVNADGSVKFGAHFSDIHSSKGVYEIDFDETYFRNGCPILTVTGIDAGNVTSGVFQGRCRIYDAYFRGAAGLVDTAFNLIAMAAE